MKNKFTKSRYIALLAALVFVFSIVMTGCGVTKITHTPSDTEDNNDGLIIVGPGSGEEDQTEKIVIGDDGTTYVYDAQGNTSVYTTGSTDAGSTVSKYDITLNTKKNTTKKSTTTTTAKTIKTTQTTQSDVYNALAYQRKFGFNKAYDDFAHLANFYLDNIRCYFEYDGRYWLVQLWKGEYAWASVGCEIGIYVAEKSDMNVRIYTDASKGPEYIHYNAVEDKDALYMSMDLWQYVKTGDATPVKKLDFKRAKCWWAADFETGSLDKHSDRTTLVMRGTIEFNTSKMRNLFCDALEDKGFKETSASSLALSNPTCYKNVERYSVEGNTVTVMWQNYKGD
ncbi:MAG: DUF4474 domain-containing protein [Clostridia bacterium]|nr:DUF4474 domain-containing protein [Clostridia bacterium]